MEPEVADIRDALERVRDAATPVLEALVADYEALAAATPSTAIGMPVDVPDYVSPVAIREIADRVARNGRGGWSLYQVEEREKQLRELLANYRSGLYRETSAATWVGKVREFRDAVLADLNTAMQAPRGWDRLDLRIGAHANARGFTKTLLTPRDVAPELRLHERTVRKRIQEGKLGPWVKKGSRWVISREAFLKFYADQLLDGDVPRPPGADALSDELAERLVHYRLRSPPEA